jgi:hypothetical protein
MPVKIKKIPLPAPTAYMPPPGMEPPSYMQPPPGVYAPTTTLQPTPQVPFNYYGQQLVTTSKPEKQEVVIPGKEDEYNIITETPYQFHYDDDRKLVMLTKPKVDKLLESINGNVFDQIQKVIDEINKGYDYIKKTKTLLAQLDYYPHLRPYEKIIRKATNLTADTEPFSLEKLQERICTDSWLALFFKKADETRNKNYVGKKLELLDWIQLKRTIISYYFNFFLFKKKNKTIKKDKLPTFATGCLRYNYESYKFKDFSVYEFVKGGSTVTDEILYLPTNYVESGTYHDDMKDGKYSDVFDLLKTVEYIFNEDDDNTEMIEEVKKTGYMKDTIKNLGIIYSSIGDTVKTSGKTLHTIYKDSIDLFRPYTPSFGTLVSAGLMVGLHLISTDGAMISVETKNTPTPSDCEVSIIKKDSNGKYVQSGFFNTLCIFVDETLDNCFNAYIAKNGPINWGKPSSNDKPFDLSVFADCQIKKRDLMELAKLLTDNTRKNEVILEIANFPEIKGYNDVRTFIDTKLTEELKLFVADPSTAKETKRNDYKDRAAFDTALEVARNQYNGLSATAASRANYKDIVDKTKTWTYTANNAKVTYTDGRASTQDGGGPKKSKPSYKKSPQYSGLKSAYKDGRISKDQFKDSKREIKRSFRRVAPRA